MRRSPACACARRRRALSFASGGSSRVNDGQFPSPLRRLTSARRRCFPATPATRDQDGVLGFTNFVSTAEGHVLAVGQGDDSFQLLDVDKRKLLARCRWKGDEVVFVAISQMNALISSADAERISVLVQQVTGSQRVRRIRRGSRGSRRRLFARRRDGCHQRDKSRWLFWRTLGLRCREWSPPRSLQPFGTHREPRPSDPLHGRWAIADHPKGSPPKLFCGNGRAVSIPPLPLGTIKRSGASPILRMAARWPHRATMPQSSSGMPRKAA